MGRHDRDRSAGASSLEEVVSGQHICLMFRDDAERFSILTRFFAAGCASGHKALFVTDTRTAAGVRERFLEERFEFPHPPAGIVNTTEEAFYPAGRFEPEAMLRFLAGVAEGSLEEGFQGARAAGEMTWALRGIPGSERLLEYEMMLTDVIEHTPMAGLCQYDVRRFDGPTILALLEVHPYVIVRGQVLRNPDFRRLPEASRLLEGAW